MVGGPIHTCGFSLKNCLLKKLCNQDLFPFHRARNCTSSTTTSIEKCWCISFHFKLKTDRKRGKITMIRTLSLSLDSCFSTLIVIRKVSYVFACYYLPLSWLTCYNSKRKHYFSLMSLKVRLFKRAINRFIPSRSLTI
jgi:hypothetical protein